MNPEERVAIIDRYRDRLNKHGESITALASGTVERRRIRFDVLAGIGNLSGCSILDLGCGLSDFYEYLKISGVNVKYTGVDIVPEFIERSRVRFPENRYYCVDIQDDKVFTAGEFDYAVCSQVFNNRFEKDNNLQVAKDVITKLYQLVSKGIAIDFITKYVDFEEPRHFYYSPEEMFSFSKKLTKKVTLRHDYPLYEFSLYLQRDFTGWITNRNDGA